MVVGRNDTGWCRSGWYPVGIGPQGVACRWSGPEGELAIPGTPQAGRKLRLVLSLPVSAGMDGASVVVAAGGHVLHEEPWCFEDGQWGLLEVNLPIKCSVVSIMVNGNGVTLCFIPDKYFGNGDLRELGFQLAGARVVSPTLL